MSLINKKLALILATVMLATSALTPVYAAIQAPDNSATGQDIQSNDATGKSKDLSQYTEQELEEQAKEAALALEQKNAGKSDNGDASTEKVFSDASETYTSEDGSTSITVEQGEDGTPNIFYDTDEELVVDESQPQTVGDYKYVGTSPLTGMSFYRQQYDLAELEAMEDEYSAEYENTMDEIEKVVNWFEREPLDEDQISEALKRADLYSEIVKNTYFEKVASGSELLTADTDTIDASPSVAAKASVSQSLERSKTADDTDATPSTSKSQSLLISAATPNNASSDKTGANNVVSAKNSTGSQTGATSEYEEAIPNDGDVIDDGEAAGEDLGIATTDESDNDGMRKAMPGTEYVQIRKPAARNPEDIEFQTIEVTEAVTESTDINDDEAVLLSAASSVLTTAEEQHTTKTAEVCIVHSDSVYFQVNSLVDENTKVGVNGAAITISYKDASGKVQTRSGVTADAGVGHSGYLSFKNMSGKFDCFVNVSLAGHATQTYFLYELEGGHKYDFNLVPVKSGQVYLRAAAIDGVDICRTGYTLNLRNKYDTKYDISYIVTVADQSDAGLVPADVIMRTVPQRKQGDAITAQNRDRKFRPQKSGPYNTNIADADTYTKDRASKIFTINAKWTEKSDLSGIPEVCPAAGDNVDKVRFTAGDLVYLDLPEGKTWMETNTNSIQLQLQVQNTIAEKTGDSTSGGGQAWWETININIFGANGTSFGVNPDIPGLRNGKFNVDIFQYKFNGSITPGGQGVIAYNPVGPINELCNSLKSQEELLFRPSFDFKSPGLMDTIKAKKDAYYQEGNALVNSLIHNKEKRKAVWNAKIEVVASLCGIFQFDKHTADISVDVSASIAIVGKGEITGYLMLGPIPVYAGVEASFSAGVTGDIGLKFKVGNGIHDLRMTDASGVSLNFMISVTAYVGVGIRKVLGFEARGGGYFSLTLGMTKGTDPFIFSGGFNVGYKVYVLFCSWSADFISKNKQFYPEEKKKSVKKSMALAAAGVVPLSPLTMQNEVRQPMEVSALIAEGRAEAGSDPNVLNTYHQYTTLDPTKKYEYYTDDTEVMETQLISQNTSLSANFQYVPFMSRMGMILRIANVETVCSDGKTRVIPRVVATMISRLNSETEQAVDYVINPTSGDPKDPTLDETEKSTTYCYDYSFSGVMTKIGDTPTRYTVVITSGPENQEELEIEAINEALSKGGNPQEALLECRAKNQHLRVVDFDFRGWTCSGTLVHKKEVLDKVTGKKTQDYGFVGTPVVMGEYPEDRSYNHWWAACPIATDIYSGEGKSNGYFVAQHDQKTRSYVQADGKNRTNICLMYRRNAAQRLVSDDDEVMLISAITDDDIKNPEYNPASQSSTGGPDQKFSAPRKIEKDIWIYRKKGNTSDTILKYAGGKREFSGNVVNLGMENQDPSNDMYFTVEDDIYRANYNNSFKKLTVTDDYGNPLTLPKGDNILNYYTYDKPTGEKVLNIVCAYNKLKEFKATPSGEDISLDTDMVIAMYTLVEKTKGSDTYVFSGPNESLIPDRSIYQMDGGICYDDSLDAEPGIKIYYLANVTSREVEHSTLSDLSSEFKSYANMCNLYIWNWKADYGAKLTDLRAKSEVVQYNDKKFSVLAQYKNVAPKAVDGVMLEYRTIDRNKKSDIKTIEFNGTLRPGDSKTGTIEIPIEKDWDGWVKVEACVSKVKVGDKWLDSNEAGFKPVWISSENLAGKLDLMANLDDSFDTDLSFTMDLGENMIAANNLRLKVYKQTAVTSEQGISFVWDNTPYQMYKIEKMTGGSSEEYPNGYRQWNLKINTATVSEWFSGLYTEGTSQQLTNRYQRLTDIDYSKLISGLKFELCGYGDDTWNVPYDTEIIYNPMYDQVCNIDTRMDNPYAGYVDGIGYVRIDGETSITAKAHVNDGYKITSWKVSDGVPYEVKPSKTDECTFTPYKEARYISLIAQTERDNDYFIARVLGSYDESGNHLDNMYAGIGNQNLPGTHGNDGCMQYAIKKLPENNPLKLHIDYDYHTHKFAGWYSYVAVPGAGYATESEILATCSDLEISYSDYPSGMVIVKPVFLPQDNPMITFNPVDGSLLGLEDAATNDDGTLPDLALQFTASKEGYEFAGWYTADGKLVDSKTKFTQDSTVYAHYKSLRLGKVIARSNYQEYGEIVLNGVDAAFVEQYVYDKDDIYLYANPNTEWGYEFDGWKVYERETDGSYTDVTNKRYPYAPPIDPGAQQYYVLAMNEKDVIIIAQFKKTQGSAPNIFFLSGFDERGNVLATCSAVVSTGQGTTLDMLDEFSYKVNYADAQSWAGIYIDSALTPDCEDDYYFDGFYKYSFNPDGTVKLGEKLSSKYLVERIKEDQFIYASWIIKRAQPLRFEKDVVNIDAVTKGNLNKLSGAVGEVTYSSSDTSTVSVNAHTGEILEPKSAGIVIITAKARAVDEYTTTSAEYTLVISRADQKLSFDNKKMTIGLDGQNPVINGLEGAKTTVRYKSDNPDIATVSMYSGELSPGIYKGDTVVTVTAEQTYKYKEAKASYEVHVNGKPQIFAFDESYVKKAYGDPAFTVGWSDSKGEVTLSSDHPSVATVDAHTGKVTVGVPGKAIITASAQGTPQYEPGKATYTLEVEKATQSMYFEWTDVTKKLTDGDFVNTLNDAKGSVTYQSTDRTVALVDENGKVVMRSTGDVAIVANSSETELYKEGIASFVLHVQKGEQQLSFGTANPTVEYGTTWYTNVLKGAKTPVTYTAEDISGTSVAAVDPDIGHVMITNAGKVRIIASASETSQYTGDTAEYILTVTQRDINSKGIKYTANRSRIVILDGTEILVENINYTVATQSEGSGTRFNVTGIGNYKGTLSVFGDDTQDIIVVDSVGTEISETIPKEKYDTAIEMLAKSDISGLDNGKVPTDKIIEAVTGTGENKIPQSYLTQATTIGVIFNVDIKLESINEASGEYTYSLEPSAVVVACDTFGGAMSATSSVAAGWFSPDRTIEVTLGVPGTDPVPNKVVHRGDDGNIICTYVPGSSTSGKAFVYDTQNKTINLNVEHFSDVEISYVAPQPTPPSPSPKGGGSGGGGGGGFTGGGSSKKTYSSCWFKNAAGQWQIKDQGGNIIRSAWFCDDGIPANGKNVWYLINADGTMASAGLVQDLTGNYYSLETNHNGYFGMLRYKDGCYNCNGTNVYLQFEQSHNGSFAAIKNQDGIEQLKKIYGVTHFNISNANIVLASNIIQ